MKTCPHCGQTIDSEGPVCPLCQQDMRTASKEPASTQVSAPEFQQEAEASGQPGEFAGQGVRVYSASALANVAIVKAALESHGIACQIRGAHYNRLTQLPTSPELWVFDESQADQARQIVQEALEPPKESTSWTCPRCGEAVEGQFSECWSCGSERSPAQKERGNQPDTRSTAVATSSQQELRLPRKRVAKVVWFGLLAVVLAMYVLVMVRSFSQ